MEALVADVGGTNVRFAVADLATLAVTDYAGWPCSAFSSLDAAAAAYFDRLGRRLAIAAFAVAGPLGGERVKLTNSAWSFTPEELRASLGLRRLVLLNDFEALALSLPQLADDDLHAIGGAAPLERATKVVLGPGTGLGTAGLVWSRGAWTAVPSEGGHASFAPASPAEQSLIERLRAPDGHFSNERAICAAGLTRLYGALAEQASGAAMLAPAEVTRRALAREDPIAQATLAQYVVWLGRVAGDAALFFAARGGVYLGGGVAPRILPALTDGRFRAAFEAKGRLSGFLARLPVFVILANDAALKGAAAALSQNLPQEEEPQS